MNATPDNVEMLTSDQAHELFDQLSREKLGLTRIEFLGALNRGELSTRTEDPPVRDRLLIGFACALTATPQETETP